MDQSKSYYNLYWNPSPCGWKQVKWKFPCRHGADSNTRRRQMISVWHDLWTQNQQGRIKTENAHAHLHMYISLPVKFGPDRTIGEGGVVLTRYFGQTNGHGHSYQTIRVGGVVLTRYFRQTDKQTRWFLVHIPKHPPNFVCGGKGV